MKNKTVVTSPTRKRASTANTTSTHSPEAASTPVKRSIWEEFLGLFSGKRPETLEETVARLESQVATEEERTVMIKRAVAAKKRIIKAQQERAEALGTTQSARRFSTTQLAIMGVAAIILLLILASAIKC